MEHKYNEGHIAKDLYYFGLCAGLFLNLMGCFLLLMLPKESKERSTFVTGWTVGFLISLAFYGFLIFYYIPKWIEGLIYSATKSVK